MSYRFDILSGSGGPRETCVAVLLKSATLFATNSSSIFSRMQDLQLDGLVVSPSLGRFDQSMVNNRKINASSNVRCVWTLKITLVYRGLAFLLTSLPPFVLKHIHYNDHIMILRFNGLRASSSGLTVLPPDFLVPALSSSNATRPFSSTSRTRSRIGSLPLSVPQGVDLSLLSPSPKKKNDIVKTELPRTLEITGPLGERHPK